MSGAGPRAPLLAKLHLLGTAGRTDDTLGPASHSKVVDAIVGIREVDDCFLKTLWFAHGLVLHAQTLAEKHGRVNYIIAHINVLFRR